MAKINVDESTLQFLKGLQKQMQWEEDNSNDSQASPRFWVIMDYKLEVGHEDYHNGDYNFYYIDGEEERFEDVEELVNFLVSNDYHKKDDYIKEMLEEKIINFYTLWEHLENSWDGFVSLFEHEKEYIVPDTMFITKKEAKEYLEKYGYNHSKKAHTYAMTALRSPSVDKLWFLLKELNF